MAFSQVIFIEDCLTKSTILHNFSAKIDIMLKYQCHLDSSKTKFFENVLPLLLQQDNRQGFVKDIVPEISTHIQYIDLTAVAIGVTS